MKKEHKVCIATYMLEQEFEPRCASTSYTRPIFSKGKFSKLVPSHCLEAISTHVDLFYRSPPSVSAAPKQWNQRMVSREQSPGKCQRALESCWERGVPATLLPTSTSLSLQVKAAESGQLTRRPHKLLRCKGSIFPTATLPSTSPSSLPRSTLWLPLPTGSGRIKADVKKT